MTNTFEWWRSLSRITFATIASPNMSPPPFGKLDIHRHDRRFLLVSSCDELEKQAWVIPVYRKISRLIDLHRRLGFRLQRENPGRPYVQLFLKILDDSVTLLQFGIC